MRAIFMSSCSKMSDKSLLNKTGLMLLSCVMKTAAILIALVSVACLVDTDQKVSVPVNTFESYDGRSEYIDREWSDYMSDYEFDRQKFHLSTSLSVQNQHLIAGDYECGLRVLVDGDVASEVMSTSAGSPLCRVQVDVIIEGSSVSVKALARTTAPGASVARSPEDESYISIVSLP